MHMPTISFVLYIKSSVCSTTFFGPQEWIRVGSKSLFIATHRKEYIKSVNILIPTSWTDLDNVTSTSSYTFTVSHVKIHSCMIVFVDWSKKNVKAKNGAFRDTHVGFSHSQFFTAFRKRPSPYFGSKLRHVAHLKLA